MHGLVGDCALLGIHKQEGGLVSATMIAHTIAEQVGDALRAELLAGEHGAGTPLREEELATRFGVSRHPIRKVLQQLTLEGLLTSKANCGVVVADSTAEHVQGLLTPMRQQLERYALRLALPKLAAADRTVWDRVLTKMRHAADDQNQQEVLRQDAAFHQLILTTAELDEFLPLWQGIYCRMREYHAQGNSILKDLHVVAFVHERLLESFFSGDEEQAVADLNSHLENGEFNLKVKQAWQRQQRRLKG